MTVENRWLVLCVSCFVMGMLVFAGIQRYPVGRAVPPEVYTAPFDPCDPIYKFIQPAPADWAQRFGANERTALIHAISELRVVVAAQGRKLLALEAYHRDPNEERENIMGMPGHVR